MAAWADKGSLSTDAYRGIVSLCELTRMDLVGNGPSSITDKHFAGIAMRVAAAVVVAGLVAQAAVFLTESWGRLRAPHDNNYPESLLVWQAMEWADGHQPYRDYRLPPFAEALYGPLAYAPTAAVVRLTGAGQAQTAWIGRGFSVLATIGILLVFTAYLRRHGSGWPAVALVLVLYLSQRKLLNFAVCFRPDHQAAFLALAGMMLFAHYEGKAIRNGRRARGARCLGVLCFAGAVYTKQDFIAAPLSLALCWLAARRWRDLLVWIVPLVLLGLAVFGVLAVATGGMYGLNTIDCLRSHPYDWSQLMEVLRRDLPESLLAFGTLFAAVLRGRSTGRRDPFVWYFWVSLAIHLAALGKKGANVNYLLEPLTAGMVPAGIWLTGLFQNPHGDANKPTDPNARAVVPAAVGLALPAGVFLLVDALLLFPSLPPSFERREMELQAVETAARVPAEGFTLADDTSLAIRLGGRPMLLDIYHWKLMVGNGAINPEPLVAALERGEADRVVYKARVPRALDAGDLGDLFGNKVAHAIVEGYRVERVVAGYVIAVPTSQP